MKNMNERLLAELPNELFKFMDTLSETELDVLSKVDPMLIAKIYQAGAVFTINATHRLIEQDKS